MAAFGAHFAVAFQSDLEAIFSKYTQPLDEDADEIYLSEFCDQDETENSDTDGAIYGEDDGVSRKDNGRKISDNDDDDNERDDDNDDDDDDGQDSDASGPISSFLRDLTGDSLTMEDDVQDDESVPMKNETFTVSKLEHYTEDKEVSNSETEGSISDHDVSMEKLQVENTGLQNKCGNWNKRTCNATFVVDKSKSNPYSAHQGLSQFYKKPVSVVLPITSSGAKCSGKTSPPKEDYLANTECSGKLDLAQAVLCSRNKIALALVEMVKGKQPHVKPSQVVSAESTCHTGGETEPYSSDEEESSSANTSSEEPCYRFGETGIKKNIKGDKINRGQIKASNAPLGNSGSKVLDSGTQQPMCYNEEHQGPIVRRRSLKLTPSFMDHFKCSPHSIKLESSISDIQKVTSLPVKRKSAPLCKLGGSVKIYGQGTNFNGGVKGSPIMFPGSKALGTPSRHHSTPLPPLVKKLVSPAQQPSCSDSKTSRRSSQVLKVRRDTEEYNSKRAYGECHKETCVTHFHKGVTFPKTSCFTTQLASRTSSPDGMAGAKFTKQSQFFKTEDLLAVSRESQVRNCNITSSPLSSHQTPNALLIRGEAVCVEKGDSCSSVNENRRDRRLSCSKANIEPAEGNCRPKTRPSAISSKNSSDNRGRKFDMSDGGVRLSKNIETAEEQDVGLSDLNCKRKLLEINKPFRTRANKERLRDDRAGLRSTDRTTKTLKNDTSSPIGSSKNSKILSCGLGSNDSPLKSNSRKKRARESVAMDTEDSLPKKHAKTGSPLSGYLNQRHIKNTTLSQALGWWGRESTPMKGRNVKSLRSERFPSQNTNLMSPIRRASEDPCGTMNKAVVSPFKGLGSCDKSFCFDCC